MFSKMEEDLNVLKNGRQINFLEKERQSKIFGNKYFPPPKLNSKPNPPILGLCTAQVMGISLSFFLLSLWITFLPEGVVLGLKCFACGPQPHYGNFGGDLHISSSSC
jgi:hypothetical protein